MRPDVCVLIACSLHPGAGLTLRHREEAAVVRAMVEGAGRAVASPPRRSSAAPARTWWPDIERIDTLVTDAPDAELRSTATSGIEVVCA